MRTDVPDGPSPLLVAPDESTADAAATALRAAGWTLTGREDVPREPWDLGGRALVVRVTVDEATVPDVVELAARGVGLVVVVDVEDPVVAEGLIGELVRLGPVGTCEAPAGGATLRPLTAEETAVLDELARGASVPEAAARSFLSVRTAHRRLASARNALGARSTREAVVAYMATRSRGPRPPPGVAAHRRRPWPARRRARGAGDPVARELGSRAVSDGR